MIFEKYYVFEEKNHYFNISEKTKDHNMTVSVPFFNLNEDVNIPSVGPPG